MPKRVIRILTESETKSILSQCQDNRDRAIIEFLRVTGCRAHEMLNVLIDDVDIENKRVYLRKTKARVRWKTVIEDGIKKRVHDGSDIVPRYSFLDDEAISSLRIYINERKEKTGKSSGVVLFNIDQSDSKDGRTVRNIVKRLAKAANIHDWKDIHPHSFRHTAATKMIAKNFPTPFIKKTMGWSERSRTFETTYEHADWDMMQNSFNKTVAEGDNWQAQVKEKSEKKETSSEGDNMFISEECIKNNEENIKEIMKICEKMVREVKPETVNIIQAHCYAALRGISVDKSMDEWNKKRLELLRGELDASRK